MKFACPHCDQRIETDAEFAGRVIECPNCSSKMTIPCVDWKYWAFLSYSHQDNASVRADGSRGCLKWAEWLHKELESYRVPTEFRRRLTRTGEPMPRRFFPVFQDEKELPINADLGESIRVALEQSRFLIVICSPRSASSRYVNEEVRYFKQLGRGHQILTLIVDGEPNASWGNKAGVPPQMECFCPALRHPLGQDGLEDLERSDPQEPIAGDVRMKLSEQTREANHADLRHGHQTVLEQMKLKLIAGLMGVGFDELVQRDKARALIEARSKARRAYITSTGFAVFFIAALLSALAALKQKNAAEQATGAERRARQSLLHRFYGANFLQIQRAWEEHDFASIRSGLDRTQPSAGDPDLRGWEWHYLNATFQKPLRSVDVPFVSRTKYAQRLSGSVTWSPYKRWIATSGNSNAPYYPLEVWNQPLQIWDSDTGKLVHTLAPLGRATAWNGEGDRIAAVVDNLIKIWELPSGKLVRTFKGHGGTLLHVAWRPGNNQIAAGGYDIGEKGTRSGELLVWDVTKDELALDLKWPDRGVQALAWNPDGLSLAVAWIFPYGSLNENSISLLNPTSGNETNDLKKEKSGVSAVGKLAWRREGDLVAVDNWTWSNYPIYLFDFRTMERIGSLDHGIRMSWSPEGNRLLSVSCKEQSSLFKIWEHNTQKRSTVLWQPYDRNVSFSWSPDGAHFATLSDMPGESHSRLSIWEIDKLACDHEVFLVHLNPNSRQNAINSRSKTSMAFAWNHEGSLFASGNIDGEITICDADSGASLAGYQVHAGEVLSVGWSPQGDKLLSVGKDGRVMLWPWRTGQAAGSFDPKLTQAVFAAWSVDGKRIAIGETTGRIVVWDAEHAVQLLELTGQGTPLAALQWHPHRNEIAAVDDKGQLSLWDCTTKAMIASVKTGHEHARGIAYDSAGQRLATCGDDQRVRIWNATTLETGPVLINHAAPVLAVSWNSADGRLASVDGEGVIWIWDADLGQGILRIQDTVVSPTEKHIPDWFRARDLAWSPDGLRLAASGEEYRVGDGIIHVWNTKKRSLAP